MQTTVRTHPAANLRVSDADRDAVVAELSDHFQAGRLTADELDERTGRAIRARTGQDLDELLADLPAGPPVPSRSAGPDGINDALSPSSRRRAPGSTAVTLAAVAAIIAALAVLGHGSTGLGPWWLIPVAFLVIRQLTRNCCRRR